MVNETAVTRVKKHNVCRDYYTRLSKMLTIGKIDLNIKLK